MTRPEHRLVGVRRAAVAGLFYPADPHRLRAALAECANAPVGAGEPAIGAVVPHAGYIYSGRVAGAVFERVWIPSRVVILAPNHTGAGLGLAAFWPGAAFETPLGSVPVDTELADALASAFPLARPEPSAHAAEHAVEVILPFLQACGRTLRILPLVLGWSDWEPTQALGLALAEVTRPIACDCLLIASSDMNHYEPADVGRRKDRLALDAIERLDAEGLLRVTESEEISVCGRVPAAAMLVAARALGARSASVVAYANSGDVTGDVSSVVGYAGVVVR